MIKKLLITGLRRLSVAPSRVVRRRTVVGGACVVSGRLAGRPGGARIVSAAPKKNHLIEAAPFGRLDQM